MVAELKAIFHGLSDGITGNNKYYYIYNDYEYEEDFDDFDDFNYYEEENIIIDEYAEERKEERLQLLDSQIDNLRKLVDLLDLQYQTAYSSDDKSKILNKRITTMSKLEKAIEKQLKLENT